MYKGEKTQKENTAYVLVLATQHKYVPSKLIYTVIVFSKIFKAFIPYYFYEVIFVA